jgi:hypothetical protein
MVLWLTIAGVIIFPWLIMRIYQVFFEHTKTT